MGKRKKSIQPTEYDSRQAARPLLEPEEFQATEKHTAMVSFRCQLGCATAHSYSTKQESDMIEVHY